MPELIEQMYCSQQIVIPPKFPYILKRYCKAAIKTQPYDLLRWSYEYFNALAQHKPPPVKLRLEYPVYTTEGGLTRGCLKVLAQQLSTMEEVPLPVLKAAWRGFCLDNEELQRILCLCEVFQRKETVPFLHFVAVAAGLLTKTLTHTMVLLCETLTKEPDGGSAAIPVEHFLSMYVLLARMDASKDVKYIDGYREGFAPESAPESVSEIIKSTESPIEDQKLREISASKMGPEETAKKGMVAGRQMSTTSGEFIVQHVEREIMEKVNEQIDILPDPSLKKKKAKPEEVAMVRDILKNFIDDNMDVIVPEEEEVEEEELPIPTIINVYAVPGIGPTVDEHIIKDVEDYAAEVAMVQAELFMPRNIRHFMCPPLEKCIDDVPETPKKEEVPIGGAITD
ncbi:ropporin-1 isoform X2 [Papilio machaon]|uniref:ropporin-1 isoform X2 n=1 Tax=Papilio machaon TaxID=76193 RepID=UPI0006EAED47|nr:ropporin-1 isoform X2 [Papilio machaon]